jgi:hypothetical protein
MKRYNEYVPLIVSLIVWGIIGPVIRAIDPTAGQDDLGLLQALVFGLVQFYAALAFSWAAMRIIFPQVGKYVDDWLGEMFNLIEDTRFKMWFSLALFAVYFFGAIIIFSNIF